MRRTFRMLAPMMAITLGCAVFLHGPASASTSAGAARGNASEEPASEEVSIVHVTTTDPLGSLQATSRITFDNGTPVDGWTTIALYPNGSYNFSGHLHASGATSHNVRVVWVVSPLDGTPAFSFTKEGRVHGTFDSGSRDFDFNVSEINPALSAAWPELSEGWKWSRRASTGLSFAHIVDAAKDALKIAGSIIPLM
ncbi:hypothetical protein J2853_001400 [Streptosporangium lutulentum]|uniref:DUF642 domain-containing protein n=1 Tax=Streptosporangium lutulentum TaxID=1461250 RepID=A0ABT9Q618_9ACTN|nr:hypothetical protein [Streptosporangium lutulentum]MDP9842189.1 hypothetical protein [Streptosporangium lutulentum]